MYFKQKIHTGKYERLKWYIQRSNLKKETYLCGCEMQTIGDPRGGCQRFRQIDRQTEPSYLCFLRRIS